MLSGAETSKTARRRRTANAVCADWLGGCIGSVLEAAAAEPSTEEDAAASSRTGFSRQDFAQDGSMLEEPALDEQEAKRVSGEAPEGLTLPLVLSFDAPRCSGTNPSMSSRPVDIDNRGLRVGSHERVDAWGLCSACTSSNLGASSTGGRPPGTSRGSPEVSFDSAQPIRCSCT